MNAEEQFNIISTEIMNQIREGEVPVLDAQDSSIVEFLAVWQTVSVAMKDLYNRIVHCEGYEVDPNVKEAVEQAYGTFKDEGGEDVALKRTRLWMVFIDPETEVPQVKLSYGVQKVFNAIGPDEILKRLLRLELGFEGYMLRFVRENASMAQHPGLAQKHDRWFEIARKAVTYLG